MPRNLLILLVSLSAAAMTAVFRLGGIFQEMDAGLFRFLGSPEGGPGPPLWLDLLGVLLFAFGTVLIAGGIASAKARFALLSVIILQPISLTAIAFVAGHRLSPFAWLTAILAGLLGVAFHRFSAAGKRERQLREIFGSHLSPEALLRLAQQPDALSSRTVRATILNARFEGNDSSQVELLAARLRKKSAWVELQTGNRILAVWNSPLTVGAPAGDAMESIPDQMTGWHAGLVTGDIKVEHVPSTNSWQMGGEVFDSAAALCQANAVFGTTILLDLATADAVRDAFILRPVELFVQPGTEMGVEIFEPMAAVAGASSDIVNQRDLYWQAVIFFRQKRYSEALASFKKVGSDPVVQYYLKRLENLTSLT